MVLGRTPPRRFSSDVAEAEPKRATTSRVYNMIRDREQSEVLRSPKRRTDRQKKKNYPWPARDC